MYFQSSIPTGLLGFQLASKSAEGKIRDCAGRGWKALVQGSPCETGRTCIGSCKHQSCAGQGGHKELPCVSSVFSITSTPIS